MENADPSEELNNPFEFLESAEVQSNFADLNIALLRGRHIQKDDYYSFQMLSTYFKELIHYYKSLYRLELVRERIDNEFYYYLQPPDDGRSAVSDQAKHKVLSEENTMIGIMLLSMYYDRYFTFPKEIHWDDLQKEIQDSDNSIHYKKLLFNDVRQDYSDSEWESIKKTFRKALREFDVLGWIAKLPEEEGEKIHFEIKESIHRLAKLYSEEINNFEEFSNSYKLNKE